MASRWFMPAQGASGVPADKRRDLPPHRAPGGTACPGVWHSVPAIRLPLRASAWRHPVALQHAVEGAAVDAEHLSGPAHVAPALLEDAMHVATLQLRQRGEIGRASCRE